MYPIPQDRPSSGHESHAHLTDEETEAPEGETPGPKPASGQIVELELKPRLSTPLLLPGL